MLFEIHDFDSLLTEQQDEGRSFRKLDTFKEKKINQSSFVNMSATNSWIYKPLNFEVNVWLLENENHAICGLLYKVLGE